MVPARISNSDTFTIASQFVDQEYRILVGLPDGYTESAQKPYPVIYKLDANAGVGLMIDMARRLALGGQIPSAIVVGIGYPVESYLESFPMRTRDLTPTQNDGMAKEILAQFGIGEDAYLGSGGAPRFLRFLVEELIPQVETRYNASGSVGVVEGFSLGGLFASYALLSGAPYRRYIIGSPSLRWDDSSIKSLLDQSDATGVVDRIFISMGGLEDFTEEVEDFAGEIGRKWPDTAMSFVEFENETHGSCAGAETSHGLRWVFSSDAASN